MGDERGQWRRNAVVVTAWAVAVTLGVVGGLVVTGRLVPEQAEDEATGIVPVPGESPSDIETALVLLPEGTPTDLNATAAAPNAWAEARVRVPALELDQPMVEGVDLASLDLGIGHWPGTALPGQRGNMVLAGHRTTNGAPFRHLDKLAVGDEVSIDANGHAATYRVTGTEIVDPGQVEVARPTKDATATLFACHPPGSARQRIVVRLAKVT